MTCARSGDVIMVHTPFVATSLAGTATIGAAGPAYDYETFPASSFPRC